jgi:gamma-glutamyltranspeptidase/glutathione hydrolase/leukotriene-C4 hydrolase
MLDAPAWKDIYVRDNALLVEGDFVQRLAYGRTLEKIAREGAQAFYEGDIAESTVKTLARGGGVMDLDDVRGRRRP